MGDPLIMPPLVSIGTHKGKAVDLTYRQLEESSNFRAEMAGDPSLKITNLKDNLREGDVAAIAPQPSKEYRDIVKGLEEAAGQQSNNWQMGGQGLVSEALAYAHSGPDSRSTGAGVLAAIQETTGAPPPIRGVKGKWG